jgi:hypothetical protein
MNIIDKQQLQKKRKTTKVLYHNKSFDRRRKKERHLRTFKPIRYRILKYRSA